MRENIGCLDIQKRDIRTYRKNFEDYLTEMAVLNSRHLNGMVGQEGYIQQGDEIEARYSLKVHETDCRTFTSEGDYQAFMEMLANKFPHYADDFRKSFEHERQHARAIDHEGVTVTYCMWFLREEDGELSMCPAIKIEAPTEEYVNARRDSVGAPDDLSPHDQAEVQGNEPL